MNGGRPCNIKTVLKGIKVEYLVALEILRPKFLPIYLLLGTEKKGNYIKAIFQSSVGMTSVFICFLNPCDVSFQVASEEIKQIAN